MIIMGNKTNGEVNGNASKIDAIKDLIFGENIKEYDDKFQELEKQFNKFQKEVNQQLHEVSSELKSSLEASVTKLNQQNKANTKAYEQFIKKIQTELESEKSQLADLFIKLGNSLKEGSV